MPSPPVDLVPGPLSILFFEQTCLFVETLHGIYILPLVCLYYCFRVCFLDFLVSGSSIRTSPTTILRRISFFVSVRIQILNERFCSFLLQIFVTIFRFCSFLYYTYMLPIFHLCSYSHFERTLLFVSVTNIFYSFFVPVRFCITHICYHFSFLFLFTF